MQARGSCDATPEKSKATGGIERSEQYGERATANHQPPSSIHPWASPTRSPTEHSNTLLSHMCRGGCLIAYLAQQASPRPHTLVCPLQTLPPPFRCEASHNCRGTTHNVKSEQRIEYFFHRTPIIHSLSKQSLLQITSHTAPTHCR